MNDEKQGNIICMYLVFFFTMIMLITKELSGLLKQAKYYVCRHLLLVQNSKIIGEYFLKRIGSSQSRFLVQTANKKVIF